MRDISFSLRVFRRAPLVALTIVGTIALGLGVVAVAFTFFNLFFWRVDAVRNPNELFKVVRPLRPGSGGEVAFTRPEYEAIRRDNGIFTDVAAARPSVFTRIDGRSTRGMFVSGNFFDMLGVTAARGRTLTPADDEGGGRAVVVLSHHGWEKLFALDPAAIGRTLLINGHPYIVAGVMPADFRGLHQEPQDYWAPLALVDQFRPEGEPNQLSVDVIGRLKPGVSPEAGAAAISASASKQPEIRKPVSPKPPGEGGPDTGVIQLLLREHRGVLSVDRLEAMATFTPIFFAFGLILIIGCANVANLLLARGLSRQREIGVRLSLGATRWRIVRQLLTENFLLALVAAVLGFFVSRALLAGSVHLALNILPPEFTESMDVLIPPGDWRVWTFLFGGAFVSTVMFGLAPALQSTRLELIRTMRGEVTRDARPGRVRQMLIGSQVTASALLLVCAAVFLRSSYATATTDASVRTDDTVVVEGITESTRPAIIRALATQPSVSTVAASWPPPMDNGMSTDARAGDVTAAVGCKLVSPEYFDLLGISLLKGRLFAPEERSPAAGVVLISESVAQRFWPGGNALGQTIRLDSVAGGATDIQGSPQIPAQAFTVIGVVRDVRSAFTAFDLTYSGLYLPATSEQARTSLVLRVHGDPSAARRTLLDALTKIDPALGDIATMKMMAELGRAVLDVVFWLAIILGSLALALTVSGLFSVLSYLVAQRKREIGVRMAIGATPRDIVTLVMSQSLRPIVIGVVAGGVLAAVAAVVLLSTPIAGPIGTLVRAFDPLAYLISLSVIVATCLAAAFLPARRASRVTPITTLRAD